MTIKLAIIGAGAIGAEHAKAAHAIGATVAQVVDADADKARQFAEKYATTHTTDLQATLTDDSINAVIIGVPNKFHKELAIAAMEAGKDVLLEKPMAMNVAECEEINTVANRTNRVLQIGLVHRYSAVAVAAKQLLAEEKLGKIYHAKAHLYRRRSVPGLGRWFTTKEIAGGGALIDIGVHLLDLSLHLLDFPQATEVCGQVYSNFGVKMRDYVYEDMWAGPPNFEGICDVDDSAHAMVRFANGATLDLHVTWAGNFPEESLPDSMMGIFGDQGGMAFKLFADSIQTTLEKAGRVEDADIPAPKTDAFQDQLSDFLRSIESREVYGANGEQAQQVQSLIDAIYRSSAAKNSVSLR